MKKINSILSMLLCLVLIIGCIPIGGLALAEASDEIYYTIFLADPSNQGAAETDVTAVSYENSYFSTHASVYTANNAQDGWYYHSVYNYDNVESEWNRTSYFATDKNDKTNGFAWLNDDATLQALANHITVSYKVRMLQTVVAGETDSSIQFYFGTANEWTLDNQFATQFSTVDIVNSNEWNEFSCVPSSWGNFYSGFFGFKAEAYPNFVGTLAIDVKDIRFTVKESDRDAINSALAANGSSHTFESLIESYTVDSVILKAIPSRTGEIGTDVTATGAGHNYITSYDVVKTATEEGEDFFRAVSTYDNIAEVWNRRSYFKSGYDSGALSWLGEDATLAALNGFINVSYKARVTLEGIDNADVYLHTGVAQEWTELTQQCATEFGNYHITTFGEWVEYTATPTSWSNFYNGFIYFKCDVYPNFVGKVTVDFKDITFTLNNGDEKAINAALSSAGSNWTYDSLIDAFSATIAKDYVLYNANPLKVGRIGSSATVSIADEESRNPVYTAKDGEEAYFTYTDDYATVGQSEWNRRHYFNMGNSASNKGYEWMGDNTVLETLAGYVTVSAKVRVTANVTGGAAPTEYPIYFGITNEESGRDVAQSATVLSKVITETGVWTEITNIPASQLANFYSGYGVIRCECALFDGTLTIDIKDIVFTISDKNKRVIDADFSAMGSDWTFDKLVAEKSEEVEEIIPDRYLTIWETNPAASADSESVDLKDVNPDAYVFADGYRAYGKTNIFQDADGYYYQLSVDATESVYGGEKTGSVIVGNANNSSIGYGWLGNEAVLNAIAPYMHTTFEYRIPTNGATLPSDTKIVLKAANEYSTQVYKLAEHSLSAGEDGWITVEPIVSGINSVASGHSWYNGYLFYNLYSETGGITENTLVDLRNVKVVLNTENRAEINAALYLTGTGLSFDDLVCNDPNADAVDIVWFANADRSRAFEGTAIKTDDGSYYSFDMGAETNGIIESGFDSSTKNFGWLANNEFLNVMAPYFNISFEYRSNCLSDDVILNISANTEEETLFAKVSLENSAEWCSYEGRISAETFGGTWSNGDIKLYVSGTTENVIVDIRDIKLSFKYSDYDSINALVPTNCDFVKISNFLEERTYGYYELDGVSCADIYVCMLESAQGVKYDANSDGEFNVCDIVRAKKFMDGVIYLPEYIYSRIDTDSSFVVNESDLAMLRNSILNEKIRKTYNDDIIVEVDVEHPGVVGMDADYTLVITDRATNTIIDSSYDISVNNSDVTIDGLKVTVPYEVRCGKDEVTVTVSHNGKYGRYTFDFQKFSGTETFRDDFNTLDNNIWTSNESEIAPFISDGTLALTATTDAKTPGISSGKGFMQAYGCFSTRVKTPAEGLVNSAFWLKTTGNDYIKNIRNPQWSDGEIDIFEYYSTWNNRWAASVHWNGWSAMHRYNTNDKLQGTNLAGEWQTYSAVWTSDAVYFYLNGNLAHIYEGVGVSENSGAMELVFTLGNPCQDNEWGGTFDASKLPATMYIDWVEVYSLAD